MHDFNKHLSLINFLQKNLEPPLFLFLPPSVSLGSRLKILPFRLKDCSKSRTLCHNLRLYKRSNVHGCQLNSLFFAPCRMAAVHFLLSKGWSYLIHMGSLFSLSFFLSYMRRLAQVYKSHRKTERPRTPQPFALELMFSACSVFVSPFPLELTSVSWIDIWWHHCSDIYNLNFCFGDG